MLVKTYRNGAELLAEVKQVLAAKPRHGGAPFTPDPLEHLLIILLSGRNYSAVELALNLDEDHGLEFSLGKSHDAQSEFFAPVRMVGRQLGELRVFSTHEYAFSSQDRVMLKQVAQAVARFLTGAGKHVLRVAHGQAAASFQAAKAGETTHS